MAENPTGVASSRVKQPTAAFKSGTQLSTVQIKISMPDDDCEAKVGSNKFK